MKKFFFLPLAALCFGFTNPKPSGKKSIPPPLTTAGVYLYFTGGSGTNGLGNAANGHADELELTTYTGGEAANISSAGAGIPTATPPQIADLIVDKLTDKSSQRLRARLMARQQLATVELRIYNGVNTAPVYKIVMTNVFISGISSVAQLCSSGTCTELHEVISFHPTGTIAWSNYPINTNGTLGTPQVVTYDLDSGQTTSNGL